MRRLELAGMRFGRLVAVKVAYSDKKVRWWCVCDCGIGSLAVAADLVSGKRKSCGCWSKEKWSRRMSTLNLSHGHARGGNFSPTYQSWLVMRARCRAGEGQHLFRYYAGRGIGICERWGSFENFLADMGERPEGRSLDRVDNNRGYEPGNCRWATAKEQANNRRPMGPRIKKEAA